MPALNDNRDRDEKAAENWLKFAKIIGDLSYDLLSGHMWLEVHSFKFPLNDTC